MRSQRHGTSLVLGTASPLPLGLAILGSQLPDIDTTASTIGKIFYPISSWIEDRFPHRSVTHCLLVTVGITVVCLSINDAGKPFLITVSQNKQKY